MATCSLGPRGWAASLGQGCVWEVSEEQCNLGLLIVLIELPPWALGPQRPSFLSSLGSLAYETPCICSYFLTKT